MKKLYVLLAAALFASSASAVDYYIIGDNVNGKSWSLKASDCKFAETETAGVYEWTGNKLGTGFKINDGTWGATYNIGAQNGAKLTVGTPFNYWVNSNSGNIAFNGITEVENPRVILNTNDKTITVTGQGGGSVEYFLMGVAGNWSFGDSNKFAETAEGSKIYKIEGFEISAVSADGLAVASTGWGEKYGTYSTSTVFFDKDKLSRKLEKVEGEAGNVPYSMTGTFDVEWNLNTMTLSFTQVGGVNYPEVIYLVGNINNGDFSYNNNLAFNAKEGEEGVYESEVTFTGTLGTGFSYFSFISNGQATSWGEVGARYGARSNDFEVVLDEAMTLMPGENAFKIADGTYNVSVNLAEGTITVSEVVVIPPVVSDDVTFNFSSPEQIKECYSGDLSTYPVKISGVTLEKDGVKILPEKKSAVTLPGPVFAYSVYATPNYFFTLYLKDEFTMIAPDGKKFAEISFNGEHGMNYIEKLAVTTEGAPALVPYRQDKKMVFEPTEEQEFTSLSLVANSVTWITSINVVLADASEIGVGVESIEAEVAPVYYNMQGVRVAQPENGLYIEVRGNDVRKVMIRK